MAEGSKPAPADDEGASERFRLAALVASDLIYEWIIGEAVIDWYGDVDGALGLEPATLPRTIDAWLARIHPEDMPRLEQAVEHHRRCLEPLDYEYRIRHADGSWRTWKDRGIAVADDQGKPVRVVGVCTDITARREVEEALRESEERFRTLATEINDGLFITDERGGHVFLNRALANIYGYDTPDELLGKSFIDMLVPEQRQKMTAAFAASVARGKYPRQVEVQAVRRDGSIAHLIVRPVPVREGDKITGSRGVVTDVTEQRLAEKEREKLEEQLKQSQKMEAIGRLAGGVAHDFNNLLTAILGYADIIKESQNCGEPMDAEIDEIIKASRRAASLTQQLLAFSRKQVATPRVLDLNEVLTESRKLLERIVGEDVDLVYDLAPELWLVRADLHQLDQVVVNLVVNAMEAMPGGGRIVVSTSNLLDPGDLPHAVEGLEPGPHVCLGITDTGTGMDPETLSNVFEPFFTTKADGLGTGLGLSTVYGIVRQNSGGVHVESEPGRGSTFSVYLPSTTDDVVE